MSSLNQNLAKIIDELDFEQALRRVKYDTRYDFLKFPVELSIFEAHFEENIAFLKESIEQGKYEVKSLRRIWVPKRDFFLRPGSLPHLDDRILFQALIDKVAIDLEALLPPFEQQVVFSSRLAQDPKKSRNMFRHPRNLWIQFQKRAIQYCEEPGIHSVLVSDIASYFENIDLRLLADTLTSSGISLMYVEVIQQILTKWANGRTRGLPQMLAPCSLLANVYLSQVDKNMILFGYKYIRYVDDIRIFVSSEVELRQALLELTDQLKNCYLDIQSSKTQFYLAQRHKEDLTILEKHFEETGIEPNEDFDAFYFQDPEFFEDIDPADEEVLAGQIQEESLLLFLSNILSNRQQYDDRHLRYCINRLGLKRNGAARDLVLSKLRDMPQETATFVGYLSRIQSKETAEEIIAYVVRFLSSEYNIYDWQMMWLLIFLIRCENMSPSHLQALFKIERLQRHPLNRALLSYLLCSMGDLAFKRLFISRYGQEQSLEVKIAILCGVYHLEKKERNRFYGIAGGDRQINQLIRILKNRKIEFVSKARAFQT